MNTPHQPTSEPQDQDIAALFEAQSVSVPEQLDSSILAAATQAVSEPPSATESNLNSTPEQSIQPLSKTANRWFALAATIVVGISVAPLLLKAPESSLDAPISVPTAEIRSKTLAHEASAPPQPASIVVDEDILNNGGAAGDDLVIFAPVASTALRTESDRSLKKVEVVYRNTIDDWMKEILRLESLGKTNEASTEYKLFRDKHPEVNPDFKLLSTSTD